MTAELGGWLFSMVFVDPALDTGRDGNGVSGAVGDMVGVVVLSLVFLALPDHHEPSFDCLVAVLGLLSPVNAIFLQASWVISPLLPLPGGPQANVFKSSPKVFSLIFPIRCPGV